MVEQRRPLREQRSARGADRLVCVTPRRARLFVLVASAGCRDVNVVDDDASATSIGGAGVTSSDLSSSNAGAAGGGGAEPVPRVITVDYRGYGDPPLDDGRVIVSDADGTVREVLLPSELPADVLVTDGQLVSFFRWLDGLEIPLRIESFRVSPSVTKIVGGYPPFVLCDVEPMLVTMDFAEVPGAYDYIFVPSVLNKYAIANEPGAQTLEVATCDETFDLLAYVRGGETPGYELFQALPFVSGGALALSTTTSWNERGPLEITIEGLDDAASLSRRHQGAVLDPRGGVRERRHSPSDRARARRVADALARPWARARRGRRHLRLDLHGAGRPRRHGSDHDDPRRRRRAALVPRGGPRVPDRAGGLPRASSRFSAGAHSPDVHPHARARGPPRSRRSRRLRGARCRGHDEPIDALELHELHLRVKRAPRLRDASLVHRLEGRGSARGDDSLVSVSSSSCAALLFVAAANGCSDVQVVDDDTGATSIGGAGATSSDVSSSNAGAAGGGGAEPLPRMITLEYRGNGGSPLDDGRVLVSDADGTLRDVLLPSELPADVLVSDGQLVSFLRRDGIVGQMSAHPLRIDSFRVTPSVTTKIVGGVAPWGPTCDVEPMTVTVDFADVDYPWTGSPMYEIFANDDPGTHDGGEVPVEFEVAVCDGTTFDLLATARGNGQTLGHELFEGLAFVPGGELQLSTTTSSIERASLDLTIEGLEGAKHLSCYANWQHHPIWLSTEGALAFQVPAPPPQVVWTATPIVPGGSGYGETSLYCTVSFTESAEAPCAGGSSVLVLEPAPGTSQTIDLDHGLARPEVVGAADWIFVEPGDIGDVVWVSRLFGGEGDPLWYLQEDPAFPMAPPGSLELPSDLPDELVPPANPLTLLGVGHRDFEDISSYGERLAGAPETGGHRTAYAGLCD